MSIFIDDQVILSPEPDDEPLTHTRILYRTLSRKSTATISASSEQSGFPASAAANELTYEFWRPNDIPATWEIDVGIQANADAVGIASHTLEGFTVEIQYNNAGVWTTLDDAVISNNDPVLFLFSKTESDKFRVRVSGKDGTPSIGVIFIGVALQMQRPIYGGHTPVSFARSTNREPNKSERGQWLGLSLVRRGVATDFSWQNLTAQWARDNFEPFITYATQSRGTFFIGWRPAKFPDEVAYAWLDQSDVELTNMGTRDLMEGSIAIRGQLDFRRPDIEDFS